MFNSPIKITNYYISQLPRIRSSENKVNNQ